MLKSKQKLLKRSRMKLSYCNKTQLNPNFWDVHVSRDTNFCFRLLCSNYKENSELRQF